MLFTLKFIYDNLRYENKQGRNNDTKKIKRRNVENYRKQRMLEKARAQRKYKMKKYIERINAERRSKGY